MDLSFPDWELYLAFDPPHVPDHHPSLVTQVGRPIRPAQGQFTDNNLHLSPEPIYLATRGRRLADADMLPFPNPDAFVVNIFKYFNALTTIG